MCIKVDKRILKPETRLTGCADSIQSACKNTSQVFDAPKVHLQASNRTVSLSKIGTNATCRPADRANVATDQSVHHKKSKQPTNYNVGTR
jgi:hypothetical protein